MCSYWWKNGRS